MAYVNKYSDLKYEYKYKYWDLKYKYRYKYFKLVLEYKYKYQVLHVWNNVQAEHHCLQVYPWGSSILSDEFVFLSLLIQVVVIFTQQHTETC